MMREVEEYVREVMKQVPPPMPNRHRIEADVRTHLYERVDAGESAAEAIARMGSPEEVAEAYLAESPVEYASLGRRIGAFLVDVGLGLVYFLSIAAAYGLMVLLGSAREQLLVPLIAGGGLLVVVAALGAVLSILYFPVLEAVYGQTLGKRLLDIYVARESGVAVGGWAAVLRRLPLFFEFFWLDALFAPFTEKRQRAFDIVAGTVVLSCRPGTGRLARPARPTGVEESAA